MNEIYKHMYIMYMYIYIYIMKDIVRREKERDRKREMEEREKLEKKLAANYLEGLHRETRNQGLVRNIRSEQKTEKR